MNAHPNTHPNAEAAPQADGQHDECSVFAWPGLFARIDPADEDLTGYRWYSQSRPTGDYVWRREARTRRKIYLAREIAERAGGLIEGHDVDHINGDTLDNRRQNLRVVSRAENSRNTDTINPRNRSGHRGVSQNPGGSWSARITTGGKDYYIGTFGTLEAAVEARLAVERQQWGVEPRRAEAHR